MLSIDFFCKLIKSIDYELAFVGDISKAYNLIKTGMIESHVCRCKNWVYLTQNW